MAVLLECSAGELVIDLLTEECPIATTNFLKLCKIKYYNGCLFYNVQQNYICQTGDPTGSGKGGSSVYGLIDKAISPSFNDEISKQRKMNKVGLVCMAHDQSKENANRSQFFITLRAEDFDNLDGKYTIFGEIAEGLDVLQKINELYCDGDGRPYQDMRIKHTHVLDDPFPDLPGMDVLIPPSSPERSIPEVEKVKKRIPYEEGVEMKVDSRTEAELEQSIRSKEAKSRAIVLEMTGDIPDADVKPPDEVLFVCKLNSVTTDADLELIFSRFGTIVECAIVKDFKTGDSLSYAFIEFETAASCIEAYEKMNNVLIDDRRIKVDFSQSVSNLWNRFAAKPRNNKAQGQMQGHGQDKSSAQPQQQHKQQQQQQQRPQKNQQQQQQQQRQHTEAVDTASSRPRDGSRWSSNDNNSHSNNHNHDQVRATSKDERGPDRGSGSGSGSHHRQSTSNHNASGDRDRDRGNGNHFRERSRSRSRSGGDRGRGREKMKGSNQGDSRYDDSRNRIGDGSSKRPTDRQRSRSKDKERDRDRGHHRSDDRQRNSSDNGRDRDRDRDGERRRDNSGRKSERSRSRG